MVAITNPGCRVHKYSSGSIRRREQAQRGPHGESHSLAIYYWQEIGDRVGSGGCRVIDKAKGPNVDVQPSAEVFLEIEGFNGHVGAVLGDSADDKVVFTFRQEFLLGCFHAIREVDENEVANGGYDAGEKSLDDVDPSPCSETSKSVLYPVRVALSVPRCG